MKDERIHSGGWIGLKKIRRDITVIASECKPSEAISSVQIQRWKERNSS
jgi:hypothetical protein